MAKTLTPNDLAAEFGVTSRVVRKIIRASVRAKGGTIGEQTPGKGKRYAFDARQTANVRKMLAAYVERNGTSKDESKASSEA